jgi:ATP dependent DNA ligase
MKKISLVVLAVCSLLLVACKKPIEQQENFKVKFEVKYKPNHESNWVDVKEGTVITIEKPNSDNPSKPDEYVFDGKIFTDTEFMVVIDAVRDYQEGTTDSHCTNECKDGNGQKTETITPEMSVTKEEGMLLQWHCTPKNAGNNIVSLTLYPKDEPKNKLTFKINFKK